MANSKRFQCNDIDIKDKYLEEKINNILIDLSEEEKRELFKEIVSEMVENSVSSMKEMFADVCSIIFKSYEEEELNNSLYETEEIKNLFMDWVSQVQVEINEYAKGNSHNVKEIAEHFRLSEESVTYFLKNDVQQ